MPSVNSAGESVTPDPERTTGQEERTVTLAPGARAWSALVSPSCGRPWSQPFTNPAATVTPVAVLVTPPDETVSLRVDWTGRLGGRQVRESYRKAAM
ncbi:DUF4232 domain-containing protein [Streptomyces sp. NPDC047079]|uniref:DUF4232 domain-containing protein n=1 Tax=Streptomyces sp. NPDC047079 TaxID=3154607 RepID=UPI0033DA5B66